VLQVGIVPRDVERSLRFYRDTLGLTYKGRRQALEGRFLHLFDCDGGTLKLLEPAEEGSGPKDVSPPGFYHEASGFRWVTMDVDDLDEMVSRCAGAPVQLPACEFLPGIRVAIIEDPDGNAIELVERH